jgi:hypothetical protein
MILAINAMTTYFLTQHSTIGLCNGSTISSVRYRHDLHMLCLLTLQLPAVNLNVSQ